MKQLWLPLLRATRSGQDLTGRTFSRLTALRPHGWVVYYNPNGSTKTSLPSWMCQCSCGKEVVVRANSLLSGNTKSCGCLHKEWNRSSKGPYGRKSGLKGGS